MENRLLIVDDDLATRRLLTYLLEPHYQVFCASNGLEAKTWLDEGNDVDLLVTDIQMPIVDGIGLIELVQDDLRFVHLPIVVISSLDEADIRAQLPESNVQAFLKKPIEPKALFWKIEKVLAQTALL